MFVLKQLLPTFCPVKSYILSFHFHIHLSDRSFALLSRAMVASCQARPSVRIVLKMEEGTPKQTTRRVQSPHQYISAD